MTTLNKFFVSVILYLYTCTAHISFNLFTSLHIKFLSISYSFQMYTSVAVKCNAVILLPFHPFSIWLYGNMIIFPGILLVHCSQRRIIISNVKLKHKNFNAKVEKSQCRNCCRETVDKFFLGVAYSWSKTGSGFYTAEDHDWREYIWYAHWAWLWDQVHLVGGHIQESF